MGFFCEENGVRTRARKKRMDPPIKKTAIRRRDVPLKKDGYFYISTPNLASWFNRVIFLFGYQPFFTEISNEDKTLGLKFTQAFTKNRAPLGHIRVFTLKGLIDLLEYHGFVIMNKYGGKIEYLPRFMKPFDKFFSNFPYLASDLFVVARKK